MKRRAFIAAAILLVGFGASAVFYFNLLPRSVFGSRAPAISVSSSFKPDPLTQQIIAAGNPYASPTPAEAWLGMSLIEQAKGDGPGNVKLFSKFEPVISRAANGGWEIAFKP